MKLSFLSMQPEILIMFLILFLLIVVLIFANISNSMKIKRLRSKYNRFMVGRENINIEELLDRCIEGVNQINQKNKDIEVNINKIERNLMNCTQKMAMIRYNAFENMGSDLSFSIALLDNNDDGIVISGIYTREGSFTYAKPILAGKTKYALSAEEMQALDLAKKNHRESLYIDK